MRSSPQRWLARARARAYLAVHTGLRYGNAAGTDNAARRLPADRPRGAQLRPSDIEDAIMDAKTGANIKTGKLTLGDKNWSFPLYDGTLGPAGDRHQQALRRDRRLHLRSRLHLDRELRIQDHLHRRRRRRAALSRLSDRAIWPSTATFSRPATCCFTANCRPPRRRPTSTTAWSITRWSTSR